MKESAAFVFIHKAGPEPGKEKCGILISLAWLKSVFIVNMSQLMY